MADKNGRTAAIERLAKLVGVKRTETLVVIMQAAADTIETERRRADRNRALATALVCVSTIASAAISASRRDDGD